MTQNTSNTHGTQASKGKFLQEALVSPKGSVSLSPQKAGRRQSWGPHMSRYDRATSVVHAYDDFSGFRKWHQGLFDENKGGAARAGGGGGERSQSLQRSGSEAGGGNDRGLQSFSMDGMDRSAFSLDAHAHQPRQQQLPQYPGEENQDRDRASPASSKYSPDGRLAAPLSVDSAEMAAYFAEEEAALASHRREASVASKRVADAANAKAQENRTSAQPEDGYARNFTTKGEASREKNRREDDEFSSSGLPTLPLSMPTVSHSEPHIAQQLRSRLQAQTRSQMQEQEDRQLPVHDQDTSAAAAVTRSVTLLPMERKDSSDFSRHMQQRRIDRQRAAKALSDDARTSSPILMAAASPSRLDGAEESFQAELRAFDLPSFPAMLQHQQDHPDHQDADLEADHLHLHEEAQRTQAIERSAEADGEVFVDIEHRIEAEEEALSNYLIWLENQHSGSTPLPSVSKHAQAAAAAAAAPAVTPAAASSNSSNPSVHSSGIPRYSGLSKSADGDEPGASLQSKSNPKSKLRVSAGHHDGQSGDRLRVFSPRDAAMRAEQANVVEPEDGILFGSETKHNGVNPLRKLFR